MTHIARIGSAQLLLSALVGCAVSGDQEAPALSLDWVADITHGSLPGVVQVQTSGGNAGSGFVVDERGWVITNAHVAAGAQDGVVVFADPPRMLPYTLVAEGHSRDLALLRVHGDGPLAALPLGRSETVPLGSRLVVIGAPQQMFPVVTSGILSGRMRPGFPGVSTPPEQLMISAPTLKGNSGSPVLDPQGRVIGVMSAKPQQEPVLLREPEDDAGRSFDHGYRRWAQQPEAFGLIVPVDDLRMYMTAWVAPEQRSGLETGLELDPYSAPPRVTAVTPGSGVALAGVRVGDEILKLNGSIVEDALDFTLLLHDLPAGDYQVQIQRGSEELELVFERKAWSAPPRQELVPGLTWSLHDGLYDKMPARTGQVPVATGRIDGVALPEPCQGQDGFALELAGFVDVPSTGSWRFTLVSDDGSQLFLHDRLVVDNDGLHGDREAGGTVDLEAGLHPLRIRFFEKGGAETLRASMGPEGGDLTPLSGERLWSLPGAALEQS